MLYADTAETTSVGTETGIFDTEEMVSFYITIAPEDWERMQPQKPDVFENAQLPLPPPLPPNGEARDFFQMPVDAEQADRKFTIPLDATDFEYVKGRVKYKDESYTDVGIRFKGNASFWGSHQTLKKPFKFDFDRFVAEQTFHGHKKLNFSNGLDDPSLMREKLGFDLFQKAGVPAPRAVYARLYLTVEGKYEQEYLGLYVMIEQVDKRFLKDRFGDGKGLLVKPERLMDLDYLGEDWKDYERDYVLKSKKKTSDTTRLLQLIKFLHHSDDEQFAQEVEAFLNVDSFLRFLAVNTLLVNMDSYLGVGHNYYLYHNSTTGQYEMLPWDLNLAFGTFRVGSTQQIMDLDIDQPSSGRKILIDRLLNIEKYKEQYHRHLKTFIESHFHPDTMSAEIDRLYTLIHDAVVAEKHNKFTPEQFEKSISENIAQKHGAGMFIISLHDRKLDHQGAQIPPPPPMSHEIIGLKPFVVKRVASVKAQLSGEKEGYIIRYGQFPQERR